MFFVSYSRSVQLTSVATSYEFGIEFFTVRGNHQGLNFQAEIFSGLSPAVDAPIYKIWTGAKYLGQGTGFFGTDCRSGASGYGTPFYQVCT